MNELQEIQERNRRVELDKAWQVSWIRRLLITVITYVVAGLFMLSIDEPGAWLKAFIPTGGYILSTLSLPPLKRWWIHKQNGN